MSIQAKLDEMQAAYNQLCAKYGDAMTVASELCDQLKALRLEYAKLSRLVEGPKKAPSEAAVASETGSDMVGG